MNSCFLKLFKTPFGSIALRLCPYFYPLTLQGSYKRCLFFSLLVWVTLNGFYYPWPNGSVLKDSVFFLWNYIMPYQPRSQGFYEARHTYYYDFISPTYFFSSFRWHITTVLPQRQKRQRTQLKKKYYSLYGIARLSLQVNVLNGEKNGSITAP